MKKAKPRFPWRAFVRTVAAVLGVTGFFVYYIGDKLTKTYSRTTANDEWTRTAAVFIIQLLLVAAIVTMYFVTRGPIAQFRRAKEESQAQFERVVTSDDVLIRPAGPVEEDQLLRVPGNTEAESDQLLRASEGKE
jgi:hypothetical protein